MPRRASYFTDAKRNFVLNLELVSYSQVYFQIFFNKVHVKHYQKYSYLVECDKWQEAGRQRERRHRRRPTWLIPNATSNSTLISLISFRLFLRVFSTKFMWEIVQMNEIESNVTSGRRLGGRERGVIAGVQLG